MNDLHRLYNAFATQDSPAPGSAPAPVPSMAFNLERVNHSAPLPETDVGSDELYVQAKPMTKKEARAQRKIEQEAARLKAKYLKRFNANRELITRVAGPVRDDIKAARNKIIAAREKTTNGRGKPRKIAARVAKLDKRLGMLERQLDTTTANRILAKQRESRKGGMQAYAALATVLCIGFAGEQMLQDEALKNNVKYAVMDGAANMFQSMVQQVPVRASLDLPTILTDRLGL